MRNYRGSSGLAGLIIRAGLALVGIIILVEVFKAIFAIIASLLTLAVIAIVIVLVLRFFSNGPRRNRW